VSYGRGATRIAECERRVEAGRGRSSRATWAAPAGRRPGCRAAGSRGCRDRAPGPAPACRGRRPGAAAPRRRAPPRRLSLRPALPARCAPAAPVRSAPAGRGQRRRPLPRLRRTGLREAAAYRHAGERGAERERSRPEHGPRPVVAAVHPQGARPEAAPTSPRTARTTAPGMTGLGRKRSRPRSTCPWSLDGRPVT
jgi:hypothetical protein